MGDRTRQPPQTIRKKKINISPKLDRERRGQNDDVHLKKEGKGVFNYKVKVKRESSEWHVFHPERGDQGQSATWRLRVKKTKKEKKKKETSPRIQGDIYGGPRSGGKGKKRRSPQNQNRNG